MAALVLANTVAPRPPAAGKRAPATALPYLEKKGKISLRRLAGNVVVLEFLSSDCGACGQEHAALVRALAAYKNKKVRFLGVVYKDTPRAAKTFLDKVGREFDVVTDPHSGVARAFKVTEVPNTVILDRVCCTVG
jgi:peroxiredoxin